jgi:hypothetical protein
MDQVGPGDDWNAAFNGVVAALKMLFVRGDPYVRFNLPWRPLFGPVVACLFVVGLGVTLWRLLRPRTACREPFGSAQDRPGRTAGQSSALGRAREVLLLVWIPAMLLPTALAINEITPSNLRAAGLIPLVFIFPARGVWGWDGGRRTKDERRKTKDEGRIGRWGRLGVTCALLLATGFVTTRAYFGQYAPRTDLYETCDGDLADVAAYLNRADLSDTTVYVGSVHYRHPTLAFLADAYTQIKWLVGAETIVYPASGEALYLFPRSATPDADWLARYLPGVALLEAPTAPDGGPAFTGYRLVAPPAPFEGAQGDFGGVVRLLDYQVERAVSGDEADVTVVWQILAPPPHADLSAFYHLVDPWDLRWGQADPFHYAAGDWTPGEIVVDRARVPIAPGAPPGDYALKVGFSQGSDARLSVVDAAGRYAGTTVPLTVTVTRTETPPLPDTLGLRQRLDLEMGAGLTLLGVNLDTRRARPGERIHLTLFWQAHQPLDDYAVNLFLPGSEENPLVLHNGAPVHGTYPTSHWSSSEIVVDRYDARLPLDAADAPPGDYPLTLSLTDAEGETLLAPVVLGQLTLIATDRTFEMPTMNHTQHATLSNRVEFLGYDLDLSGAYAGGSLNLTLYWHALAEMDVDYTVFTHLLDPENQRVAGQDNPPVSGTYPTTLWVPGEIITDPYPIALPADLPPGNYTIEVGFYVAETGLRLADPILLNATIPISDL